MSNIHDVEFNDIKQFLEANEKSFIDQNDAYNKALVLLKDRKAKDHPVSIMEWIIAHNLLINKIDISRYSVYEIDNMSKIDIDQLAKKLTMKKNDRSNIKNILKYLHKLDIVSYNNIPYDIIYNIVINTDPLSLRDLYTNSTYKSVIDDSFTLETLYDKYKDIVEEQYNEYNKYKKYKEDGKHRRILDDLYYDDIYTNKSFNNLFKIYMNHIQRCTELEFNILYIDHIINKLGIQLDIETLIKLTTTIEYLTVEILEASDNISIKLLRKKTKSKEEYNSIYESDIKEAISQDDELKIFISNLDIKYNASSFKYYIISVLKYVGTFLPMLTEESILFIDSILYSFITTFFIYTLKSKSFDEFLEEILPGELIKHAKYEYNKVLKNCKEIL